MGVQPCSFGLLWACFDGALLACCGVKRCCAGVQLHAWACNTPFCPGLFARMYHTVCQHMQLQQQTANQAPHTINNLYLPPMPSLYAPPPHHPPQCTQLCDRAVHRSASAGAS